MKDFATWCEQNKMNEAGLNDRSLEGFYLPLGQLQLSAKSIIEPQMKQQIYQVLNPFLQQMHALLDQARQQGIGHSPRFDVNAARSPQYAISGKM